ncbi:conserved protein of unknown function [Tenacibaculum sp. 190130A14a]|uniref:Lipoprotein n=1 Tax=Tenacibaculum polynesiense TaxID=3137857 RepID=A0ABM9PE52_9FLAO
MKKILLILMTLMFLSCYQKKHKVKQEFTEKDAYEVINKHLSTISYNYDSIVYVNPRQLKPIKLKFTKLEPDTYFSYMDSVPLRPIFTKNYWKKENLKGIDFIDWDEYCTFFCEGNSKNRKRVWKAKFNNKYIHNLAYPIYSSKKKTAVIRDYRYQPYLLCGTGLDNMFYYKKTKTGWEQIDPSY